MFLQDKIYKRKEIHDQYGGNRQKGISCPKGASYIFIFSGKSGEQYGYEDSWDENQVFSYTGEGHLGPMSFTFGNKELRDHIQNGKRVFLFTQEKKTFVQFDGELELIDWEFFDGRDKSWTIRRSIRFFFKRVGSTVLEEPYKGKHHVNDISPDYKEDEEPNTTERSGLVVTRVGQGVYRRHVLERWKNRCAVTGCNDIRILVASHIVPWRDATHLERRDPHNGILLSPVYDALFDRNLISFDDEGFILLSKHIKKGNFLKLGVTGQERILNLSEENKRYLKRHRENLL